MGHWLKNGYLIGVAACLLLMTLSCSDDHTSLPEGYTTEFKALISANKPDPQYFAVNAGITSSITGAKGTKITFNPSSFKDEEGDIITGGTIDIELVEMYRPGDMILSQSTTVTKEGKLLQSGGQVCIKATMEGHEVNAAAYQIDFLQPEGTSMSGLMGLFYGSPDSESGVVSWNNAPLEPVYTKPSLMDSSIYYSFTSTGFGWINCDYWFGEDGPQTDIHVQSTVADLNATNAQVFIVVPSANAVALLMSYDPAPASFSGASIPVGTEVKIALFGTNEGLNYLAVSDLITLTAGYTITLSPSIVTLEELNAALAAL